MVPKRMSGMTLVELLIVMMIAAILVGVGVPSFRYVTNSNRMSGEINNLLGDLQFARSEALKEGQTVTICSSTGTYLRHDVVGQGLDRVLGSDRGADHGQPGLADSDRRSRAATR